MELKKVSKLLYQLKITNQEMISKFEKETGFSITRYELMMFLQDHGQCSQTQLQAELHIDGAAVTRHLKTLEEKGYVTRERNKKNNREVFVQITPQAIFNLTKCEKKYDSIENQLRIQLSDIEIDQLLLLLTKLIK